MNDIKHTVQAGQQLKSDVAGKPFVVFPNQKKDGDLLARAYQKDGDWVLVSDPGYSGSGLIVIINNPDVDPRPGSSIKIAKVLPNVVIGNIESA